jgi:hypothetical protein
MNFGIRCLWTSTRLTRTSSEEGAQRPY